MQQLGNKSHDMSIVWHASNVPSALFCDCRVKETCLATRYDAQRSIYGRVILASCYPSERSKGKSTFVSFTWTVASKDDTVIYPALDIITCWGIRFKHFAFTEQCVQNDSVLVSCKLLHLCSFVVSCAMVKRKWHEIARKYPMFGIFMYINNSYFRHIFIKV